MNKHESAPNQMLKTARLEKCWTLATAAEKANVSIEAYSRWELGKQEPRLSSLLLLSEAFGKSPEELGFGRLTKQLHPQEEQKEMVAAPLKEREQLLPEASGSTAPKLLEISIVALSLVQQQQRWSYEELLAHVETAIRRPMTKEQQEQNQRGGKLSRRQIISLMMSVPVVAFGLTEGDDAALLRDDEVLALCAVNIPLAWRLYFAGGLAEVRQMLPDYLARVSALAKQPSRYQQQAAALTSQAHQLAYLLALQNQNFGEARTHTRQSLQKYQEAVQNSTGASPLLLGQAYIGLAEAQARLGQEQEALRSKGLALEMFPGAPEEDLHYAYTHFNSFTLANFEGLMHLHLQHPRDAWNVFEQVDREIPQRIVPQRVELLSRQAATVLALGDMHQVGNHLEVLVPSARALGSDLRYNEAREIYEQMQVTWPFEQRVKALRDLFLEDE